jgi:hypothetical protein
MYSNDTAGRPASSPGVISLGIAAVLVLFIAVSYYVFQPPAPLPATAAPSEFSAVRAMEHDRAIGSQPHPSWSPAAAEARDYIFAQLKSLGLDPQIQATTGLRFERGSVAAASVKNVVARIPGTANTRAVMLAAHYDSVPSGPGASDDGSGVSTIIETVRALKAGPPLKNDLIVLVTDAEEEGLLGAAGFVADHPWAKDVAIALNFEARGGGGPSFMFETSDRNGWLIDHFAKAAPYPTANSLTYALYKILPNDTDMTEFKGAGFSGFNFAYAGDWFRYHTMLDTVDNLDQRSLQQDGSYALSLVKELGNIDLSQTKQPDEIYFDFIGPLFIHYPQSLALPLALIAAAAFIAMLLMGRRRGVLKFGGMGLGLIAVPLTLVAAFAGGSAVWWVVKKVRPDDNRVPWGDPYNGLICLVAMILVTIALAWLIYGLCGKRTNIQSLAAGALFWEVVVTVGSALYLPGGSFLFAWPLLFAVIGLIFLIAHEGREAALAPAVVLCVTALPLILLSTPIIYALYLLVSMNVPGPLMVVVALTLVPLVPHLGLIMKGRKAPVLVTVMAAIVLIVAGILTGKPGPNSRDIDDVFYALNADTGLAHWISIDARPDAWTSQFLGQNPEHGPINQFVPRGDLRSISSSAPAVQLAAPELRTVSDESASGVRNLSLHVSSVREAPGILVSLPKGVQVLDVLVNGKPVPASLEKSMPDSSAGQRDRGWSLFYTSLPKDGFDLALKLGGTDTVKLMVGVYDFSFSLPQIPDFPVNPRPDYLMLAPYTGISDCTIVGKSFDMSANH